MPIVVIGDPTRHLKDGSSVLEADTATENCEQGSHCKEIEVSREKHKEEKVDLSPSVIYEEHKTKSGATYRELKGVNCDTASEILSRQRHYVYLSQLDKLYVYHGGVYQDIGRPYTQRLLQAYYSGYRKGIVGAVTGKDLVTTSDQDEIIRKVCRRNMRALDIFQLKEPIFPVENGVLNLETLELEQSSPDRYLLNKSPAYYDPDAECPEWRNFLDSNVDEEYQVTLQEGFGYTLWPTYDIHKAFMLHGPPRAGKGLTAMMIVCIHGVDNCSSVTLHSLMDNRFMAAQLYGKRVNISSDLSANMIRDPAIFRAACGGDQMTVEYKNGHPFDMYNVAKMWALTNRLSKLSPKVEDQGAFYGRWIIIPYRDSFQGKEDNSLKARLSTKSEISGVLNWTLEGLQRLRKNNWKFTEHMNSAAYYLRKSDPLIAFLEDNYEESEDGYISKYDLRVAYSKYAKVNGYSPISSIIFNREMANQGTIPVGTCWKGSREEQKECWAGIAVKNQ